MNLFPPLLEKGDTIRIVAPAKAIEAEKVDFAKTVLEEHGFVVEIAEHCKDQYNYFSSTIENRLADFQSALDDSNVKAILCARGGYGCIQLVDRVNWESLLNHPKWIIGFSDITILHHRIQMMGAVSLHGTMPLDFATHTPEALQTLIKAFTQPTYEVACPSVSQNVLGEARGELTGGNLSIIYSLLGTDDHLDYTNKILFIEDLSEHLYVIDRIFYSLKKAGVLDQIKGLIVGGMTSISDTAVPFGKTLEEIILSHIQPYSIPVAFDFPSGHVADNRALRLGAIASLKVNNDRVALSFE